MNSLKFIFFILISFHYLSCKCRSDCSGSVSKELSIQLIDKTTAASLNASWYSLSLEGLPFAIRSFGTGKDSSIVRFSDSRSATFSKTGSFNGVIKSDGSVVGKFTLTLEASDCCGDYPESGIIEVKEGNLLGKEYHGREVKRLLFSGSRAFLILQL